MVYRIPPESPAVIAKRMMAAHHEALLREEVSEIYLNGFRELHDKFAAEAEWERQHPICALPTKISRAAKSICAKRHNARVDRELDISKPDRSRMKAGRTRESLQKHKL